MVVAMVSRDLSCLRSQSVMSSSLSGVALSSLKFHRSRLQRPAAYLRADHRRQAPVRPRVRKTEIGRGQWQPPFTLVHPLE